MSGGWIDTEADLAAIYPDPPVAAATVKVARRLTPAYRAWIAASRFCLLATVGPEGTDCSPRGDDGPVVAELDAGTLLMPDWRGNNRIDSLRNILRDGRVSLTFLVPGSVNVVRVNGTARLTSDPALLARFDRDGARPRSVIVIALTEVYFQCARALIRSRLWDGPRPLGLPTPGEILTEMSQGTLDGVAYDAEWPSRAARTMW
jgi:PPOX class probable FMN-dependent enzyme